MSTQIGKLILQDDGALAGGIRTLKFVQGFNLETNDDVRGDSSPAFIVKARGADGKPCPIGAAWVETSAAGLKYLSIQFTDPDIPEVFERVAAFENDDGQEWRIVWDRKKPKAANDNKEAAA